MQTWETSYFDRSDEIRRTETGHLRKFRTNTYFVASLGRISPPLATAITFVIMAFLGTPTDAHVVTKEAAMAAVELHENAPVWMRLLEALGLLKQNRPIPAGDEHFMDCIVVDQGPNYILSKRLQHWRAMVARAAGHVVSSNVSPATATTSVTSNSLFAAAYGGMHIFRPMEVAYQELSLSLMGALLIHDLRNPRSAANPATQLEHPLCLFQATAFHSGMWRCPYTIGSLSVPSAVRYYLTVFWLRLVAAAALLVFCPRSCCAGHAVDGWRLCGRMPK